MAGLDDRQIARWRLVSQRLAGRPAGAPDDVVRGLLGVQAENFSQAGWAVAARSTPISWPQFTAAFDDGDILRIHVLRTTWHFVTPDDLVWLVELTAPALRRLYVQSRRAYGIDDRTLDAAIAVIVDGIAADGPQTREQLRARLQDAGLPAAGPALTTITASAEAMALICSGPLAGAEQTHALVRERAPRARRLDRDEALAEIAHRYFTGHGPATDRDLAYWATLTITDVRRGLAAVGDRLARFEHDGRTFWHAIDSDPPAMTGSAHLLQILDEMYRGYQDSRWVLDAAQLVGRERETSTGIALLDGQIGAAMTRRIAPKEVVFDLAPFRALDARERAALDVVAARYGQFLGRVGRVVIDD